MTIATGRALVGLEPLSNKSFNAVYRGEVILDDQSVVRGFIKDLDPRQLANELLIAVLGSRLGVKMPQGALVAVGKNVSTAFNKLPHSNGSDFVAFCSVDAGGSTIAQIISSPEQVASIGPLKASPGLGWMYGFDTWVANVDRHMNNVLLSGDGSAYLIDHGHCFSGPNWKSADLNATKAYTNQLKSWLTPKLTVEERNKAMADITKLVGRMIGTDVQEAINDALVEQLYGVGDCDAVVGFLEGRVEHVEAMSAESLEVLL
jgi:hypothetical protein